MEVNHSSSFICTNALQLRRAKTSSISPGLSRRDEWTHSGLRGQKWAWMRWKLCSNRCDGVRWVHDQTCFMQQVLVFEEEKLVCWCSRAGNPTGRLLIQEVTMKVHLRAEKWKNLLVSETEASRAVVFQHMMAFVWGFAENSEKVPEAGFFFRQTVGKKTQNLIDFCRETRQEWK